MPHSMGRVCPLVGGGAPDVLIRLEKPVLQSSGRTPVKKLETPPNMFLMASAVALPPVAFIWLVLALLLGNTNC